MNRLLVLGFYIVIASITARAEDTELVGISFQYEGSPITIFTEMGGTASFNIDDQKTGFTLLMIPTIGHAGDINLNISTARKDDSKVVGGVPIISPAFMPVEVLENVRILDNKALSDTLGVISVNIMKASEAIRASRGQCCVTCKGQQACGSVVIHECGSCSG